MELAGNIGKAKRHRAAAERHPVVVVVLLAVAAEAVDRKRFGLEIDRAVPTTGDVMRQTTAAAGAKVVLDGHQINLLRHLGFNVHVSIAGTPVEAELAPRWHYLPRFSTLGQSPAILGGRRAAGLCAASGARQSSVVLLQWARDRRLLGPCHQRLGCCIVEKSFRLTRAREARRRIRIVLRRLCPATSVGAIGFLLISDNDRQIAVFSSQTFLVGGIESRCAGRCQLLCW